MTTIQPFQRHLKLTGCLNLRELGGYETIEGKQIKWRTLFRSDSLHRLPKLSQQQLIDYGIKTIIDLRSPYEIARENYPLSEIPTIQYFNLPLIAENQRNIIESIKHQSLVELNRFLLEERSQAIQTILTTIAQQPTPVIIHCAVGKDRTGMIIALLLAIAGVPVTTIAQDYQLSDLHLATFYEQIRRRAVKEGFTHLLGSPAQTMIDTFTYLDRQYGGIACYLKEIGIDVELCDRLKKLLVSD